MKKQTEIRLRKLIKEEITNILKTVSTWENLSDDEKSDLLSINGLKIERGLDYLSYSFHSYKNQCH